MTQTGLTMRTRLAKPSHVEWAPSEGQRGSVSALVTRTRCALWADPGAGKTSITLSAFETLRQSGSARTMLVVAPLRVCQLQWRQEALQWSQFMHLKIAFLHGPKKDEILRGKADIYLLNFDGLAWLAKQFPRGLPFDIVCLDESTKIKNHQAERSKALRKCTVNTPRKWMLTGTPNPNGYEDLFGQFLWLDSGAALGRFVTHFRDKFFRKAFNGFDYDLQNGGGERIELAIAHLVHRLPFTDLPPLVNDPRWCEMSAEGRKIYKTMDKEQVVQIGPHLIVAGSTGAHQSALEQMANGAVYIKPGEEEYVAFDDAKLDALDELIEEMNGQPLMVAFQFHHDIERIRARRGKDIHVLAGGVTARIAEETQRAWNAGEIKELYVHPASIGHGLNLQRGGASHVCWFSVTFDLELWEQLIRRLWRQGNKSPRIVNHILAMRGTLDEDKLEAMEDKSVDQARLLQAMEQDAGTPDQKEIPMTDKMPMQSGGTWGAPAPAAAAPPPNGGGWGPPASVAPAANAPEIAARLQGGGSWGPPATQPALDTSPPEPGGMGHFSLELQTAAASIGAPNTYSPASLPPEQPALTDGEASKTRAPRSRVAKASPTSDAGAVTYTEGPSLALEHSETRYVNVRIDISGARDLVAAAIKALAVSL